MPIDMNDLARRGAQIRLAELAAEVNSIRRAFPDLGGSAGKKGGRRTRATIDSNGQPASKPKASVQQERKRKPMSGAAKKSVGERMKKYWAERRKAARAPETQSTVDTKSTKAPAVRKRTLSAEARARISAAQKKRWAAQKKVGKKR
jgi:hypothetical protein